MVYIHNDGKVSFELYLALSGINVDYESRLVFTPDACNEINASSQLRRGQNFIVEKILLHYFEKNSFPALFQKKVKKIYDIETNWINRFFLSSLVNEALEKTFLYCHGSIKKDAYLKYANTFFTINTFIKCHILLSVATWLTGLLITGVIVALASPVIPLFTALLYTTAMVATVNALAGMFNYFLEGSFQIKVGDCLKELANEDCPFLHDSDKLVNKKNENSFFLGIDLESRSTILTPATMSMT